MAGIDLTTASQPITDKNFNGGLNSTSGPLSLDNSESSDLLNIDFNKFGSFLKRNGYTPLNTSAISGSKQSDGLWWYEYVAAGAYASHLINITNGKVYSMNSLDGTWNDITGTAVVTDGNICDFDNWLNTVFFVNNTDAPCQWVGSSNAMLMPAFGTNLYTFKVDGITTPPAIGATYTNNSVTYTITYISLTSGNGSLIASGSGAPETSGTLTKGSGTGDATIDFISFGFNANISKAKCVRQFNNYLFMGNVVMDGVVCKSRIAWCNIEDPLTWLETSFIDISKNDGQQIINIIVLGDRFVVFKERAIYNVFFTGDADVPFTVQKSNSNVGSIAQFSIQEVENGLVFLSYDGFYYYDGNNSYKISLDIQPTISGYNSTRFSQARSMRQKNKNRYFCSLPSAGQTNNDTVIVWDWQLNAFSIYGGIAAATMTTVYNGALEERIYFGDYAGFVYRMDTGSDDYPLNVRTAINAYYYTNWKSYDDIVDQKDVPNIVVYYQTNNAVITLVYSYDFESADTYSQTFSTATSTDVYGTALYGTAHYAGIGGAQQRRDLDGSGRVLRIGFKNNNLGETFQIDGLGSLANLRTNV